MKNQWMAYLIVALLAIGAGVAIAGLPDNAPVAATFTPATTTEAPASTVPETTEAPATTVPSTTEPETTEPETTDPNTEDPDDSLPAELGERSELTVTAANGANVPDAALRVAVRLEELGYVDVVGRDGSDVIEFTMIYFADGFEEAALRLAEDLDLLPVFVAPIENSPSVPDLPADTELLAYIGRDRA